MPKEGIFLLTALTRLLELPSQLKGTRRYARDNFFESHRGAYNSTSKVDVSI